MIRVGIVGCGKIADAHANQIRRIQGARLVGAADHEQLMAAQFCERHGLEHCYVDVESLIERAKPDVVHITTPPQSHYALAKMCMERGCHLYVEKPFTIFSHEAEDLLKFATAHGIKVTVGHDAQFSHAARRMRQLVREGYLGSRPIHMESYYCYPFGSDAYAGAVLGDSNHWVRALPGKLFQNVISHAVCSVAEFLLSEQPEIVAIGFSSAQLRRRNVADVADEVRIILKDADDCTAYITFSSQMRPSVHQFRLYGQENGLFVDDDKQIVLKLRGSAYTSYLEKFIPPVTMANQYLANWLRNMAAFVRNDFHMKSGMKWLMESFYSSITDDTELPISYREIIVTARVIEAVVSQINQGCGSKGAKGVHATLAGRC